MRLLLTVPPPLREDARVAAQLDAARLAGRHIAPPAELATHSLRDAYAIQDALVARREAGGFVRSGWKLGLTSAVKQRLMGIDHPLFGRIFADGALATASSVACATFVAPRAEPELAFGLALPLDPAASEARFLAAIDWIAPAIEITDSRYLPGPRSPIELVADNTSACAYVIGDRRSLADAPRVNAIATQFLRNEAVLASGSTSDVLGDPLNALRLLAKHLAERGLQTIAGDLILSGAITDAFPAAPGDRFEARLSGLGSATITFN